jgi:hypothetical protein
MAASMMSHNYKIKLRLHKYALLEELRACMCCVLLQGGCSPCSRYTSGCATAMVRVDGTSPCVALSCPRPGWHQHLYQNPQHLPHTQPFAVLHPCDCLMTRHCGKVCTRDQYAAAAAFPMSCPADSSHAAADGSFSSRRELCFTLEGDIFVRYQSYQVSVAFNMSLVGTEPSS